MLFLGRDKKDKTAHNVAIPNYGIGSIANCMKAWRKLEEGKMRNDFHFTHKDQKKLTSDEIYKQPRFIQLR